MLSTSHVLPVAAEHENEHFRAYTIRRFVFATRAGRLLSGRQNFQVQDYHYPRCFGTAPDIQALTQHLDITRCVVVGWSGGGKYLTTGAITALLLML